MALFLQLIEFDNLYSTVSVSQRSFSSHETHKLTIKDLKRTLELTGTPTTLIQKPSLCQLLFTIKLDRTVDLLFDFRGIQQPQLQVQISLLLKGKYSGPRSSETRKNICKTIAYINSCNSNAPVFLLYQPHTGHFRIHPTLPPILNHPKDSMLPYLKSLINASITLASTYAVSLLYLSNLRSKYSLLTLSKESIQQLFFGTTGQFTQLAQVREMLTLSTCQITFSINEFTKTKARNASSMQNAPRLLQLYYRRTYPRDLTLFLEQSLFHSNNPIMRKFDLSSIEALMKYPTINILPQDNRAIFSTIRILEQKKTSAVCIAESGKARLIRVLTKFAYGPSDMRLDRLPNQHDYPDSPPHSSDRVEAEYSTKASVAIEKILVIKMPRANLPAATRQHVLNQIEYQKRILKNLRGAECVYLPKYYQTYQIKQIQQTQQAEQSQQILQTQQQNRWCLLLDYISGATLDDELILRASTASLTWKLHLLAHLANALRFLQGYDIAHLDLSLNNIVISKDGLPKIIDFGQAYNQKTLTTLKVQHFLAGRTYPFAPPQTSQRQWNFHTAQDIYSLGVICYRLLFGYYPLASANLEQLYRSRSYHHRLLVAPEGVEWAGQEQIMLLCLQLVLRCMHPNENLRPHAAWVYLMFKKMVEALH